MAGLARRVFSPWESKWPRIGASLTDAKTHADAAADLAKQAEREYRARDAAMPGVTHALRDARDRLLVANRDNLKVFPPGGA